ncbi:MAG: hypothetical protein EAZ42_04985 [Verrucomicrobia bacterium]|nr:MAG: hypothetical protein EAZ42_04985 [Verrucomicrobiota bacterium]
MNRIYQGRVSKIELLAEDRQNLTPIDTFEGCELDQLSPLWKHHETFQDAVNYYLLSLTAMARSAQETSMDQSPQQRLASDLLKQIDQSWGKFPRSIPGPGKPKSLRCSLQKWLSLDSSSSLEDAISRILDGNSAPAETLNHALSLLLEKCGGDSAIQQGGRGYLPRLCDASYSGSWDLDSVATASTDGKEKLAGILHSEFTPMELTQVAEEMSISWAGIKCKADEQIAGDTLKKRLEKAVTHQIKRLSNPDTIALRELLNQFSDAIEQIEGLRELISNLPDNVALDLNKGGNISWDLVHAAYLFKLFPSSFTGKLLSLSIKKPTTSKKKKEPSKLSDDPIKLARGERGYVFSGFTALPAWNPLSPGKPVWKEFDIAAFKEALKALNQFNQKTTERAETRTYLNGKIAILLGSEVPDWKPQKTEGGESEELPKPLDPNLLQLADRLEARLTQELADTVVDYTSPKTLHFGQASRTLIPGQWQLSNASLRGFSDIASEWNKLLKQQGDSLTEETLAEVVKNHQRNEKNKKSIGSIPLFLALCDSDFWPLWRNEREAEDEDAAKPANNRFLHRIIDLHQAIRDYERAAEPVNLTPAEPRHSRRLYMFSDIDGKEKVVFKGEGTIESSIALLEEKFCRVRRVRLTFSAPRLKRDELLGGEASQWLQPMAKALGYTSDDTSKTFESAVCLMPDFDSKSHLRFLLNFPKKIDSESLQNYLGKSAIWNGQFNGVKDKNIHLHWPATASTKASKENPWWENPSVLKDGFTFHSVDLGQRTAGAWALIRVTPWKPDTNKPVRSVGHDGVREWFAEVLNTGMHRLPGEDQMVGGAGKLSREHYGKAGRNANEIEYQEAIAIGQSLGCSGPGEAKAWIGKTATEKSFPEQNDSLLTLANRRLTRLATFHRWSCLRVALAEKSGEAKTQIRIIAATLAELSHWQDEDVVAALTKLLSDHPYLDQLMPEAGASSASEKPKTKRKSNAAKSWTDAQIDEWNQNFQPDHFTTFSDFFGVKYASYRDSLLSILTTLANRVTPLRGRVWKWQTRPLATPEDFPYGEIVSEEIKGEKTPLIRGQRGLSIERLEQLETLRTLFLRINRSMDKFPGKLSKPGFGFTNNAGEPCGELLEKLKRMKDERVNQTAHLILAQALGVRLKADKMDAHSRRENDIHGEYERIPSRSPADFIVIENLDRYLTSQGRAPSENRRLMKWSHRAVRDKIKMLSVEPFGIPVVEAPAAYSSRYCARTGAPGSRCFEKSSLDPFLQEQLVKRSTIPPNAGHPDLRHLYQVLIQQFKLLEKRNSEINASNRNLAPNEKHKSLHTLIFPKPGGPLFLSALDSSIIQADANAAINIGLRAIAAPEAIHLIHKIRTQTHQEIPYAGKRKHTEKNAREKAAYPDGTQIHTIGSVSKSSKSKGSPNFFHLPSQVVGLYSFGHATANIAGKSCDLVSGVALHALTDAAVLSRIVSLNSQRLNKWGLSVPDTIETDDDPEDNIPM